MFVLTIFAENRTKLKWSPVDKVLYTGFAVGAYRALVTTLYESVSLITVLASYAR
jgi:hypothetical protein